MFGNPKPNTLITLFHEQSCDLLNVMGKKMGLCGSERVTLQGEQTNFTAAKEVTFAPIRIYCCPSKRTSC